MGMGAVYSAKEYVSNRWETTAGIAKGEANIQPKLDSCSAEVEKHNAATKALAEESARKAKEAATALAKASAKGKVWEDNAARLRAVLTAPRKAGEDTCSAAWAEIRKPAK